MVIVKLHTVFIIKHSINCTHNKHQYFAVYRDGNYTVRGGGDTPYFGGTLYGVARIIKHQNFNVYTFDYDIALVQVCISFSVSI